MLLIRDTRIIDLVEISELDDVGYYRCMWNRHSLVDFRDEQIVSIRIPSTFGLPVVPLEKQRYATLVPASPVRKRFSLNAQGNLKPSCIRSGTEGGSTFFSSASAVPNTIILCFGIPDISHAFWAVERQAG